MKKNFINNGAALLLMLTAWAMAGCGSPEKESAGTDGVHAHGQQGEQPDGHQGYSPDSGVLKLTRPPNREIVSSVPSIRVTKERRIFSIPLQGTVVYDVRNYGTISARFGGRIEKLAVSYNYQRVNKGQLIMELYSPDMANAQRELIYLHTSGAEAGLIMAARKRLQLLGVAEKDIDLAIEKGKPLFRIPVYAYQGGYLVETANTGPQTSMAPPTTGTAGAGGTPDAMGMGGASAAPAVNVSSVQQPSATPITFRPGQYVAAGQTLFNLYDDRSVVAEFYFPQQLAAYATPGRQLLYYPSSRPQQTSIGTIGLVVPVQRTGEPFSIVRVYLPKAAFPTGTRLTATMAVTTEKHYWVPRQAVVAAGSQNFIFRKHNGAYRPVAVRAGAAIHDFVEVLDEIGGWDIAGNAWYLVDSESFISASSINTKNETHDK